MLAIDHGYFQGPTSGLERVDLSIVPIAPRAEALTLTRGMLRSTIPPPTRAGRDAREWRSQHPQGLSDERIAVDMDDAVRMNVDAVAVQVFVGGEQETQSVENMTRLVDAGYRCGVPVLGVTAVGKELTRDARYLGLATRICAELGSQIVKTYYVAEGLKRSPRAVRSGRHGRGKKLPEAEALEMAYRAIQEGAAGVDMGRNIFQSEAPAAMLEAIAKVVHEEMRPAEAHELFRELAARAGPSRRVRRTGSCRWPGRHPRSASGSSPPICSNSATNSQSSTEGGVHFAHVDVMDGVFCPQMTVGPPLVAAIPERFVKDVHLMIDEPLEKVDAYVDAGADLITFHLEATRHPHRVLQALAGSGVARGVALDPGTPLDWSSRCSTSSS